MDEPIEFETLEALYSEIDSRALDYSHLLEIGDSFKRLRDRLQAKGDSTGAQIAQYEVDAFNLQTNGNYLDPVMIAKDTDGNEVRYPDITKFSQDEFDHFVRRLEIVGNPRLQARYAHILWNSPRKRQQYAKIATEAYVQLTVDFEAKDRAHQKGVGAINPHYGQDVIESVRCALGIAANAREGVDKVIPVIVRLVNDFNPESSSWYALNYELLGLMIKIRAHLDPEIRRQIPTLCITRSDQLRNKGIIDGSIEINKRGMRADQLLSSKTADWNRRIAECYEKLMESRQNAPMVAAEWCQRAMDYYKVAGDKAKVEELARKRDKFGGEVEFQEISTEIDQTEHIRWCEQVGAELSAHSTGQILIAISVDPDLLPRKVDMEQLARETAKATPFLSFMPEQVMDDRMHVVEHICTPEEKLKRGTLEAYKYFLRFDKIPLLNAIIYHAYRAGKIDADKVVNQLREYSWIGTRLKDNRASNKGYEYCWLDQLKPAIEEYFSHLGNLLEKNSPVQLPLTAIDSLTMKFEGLIRDYARLNGILTYKDITDNKGRTVTHERDLSQLLYDPRIAQLFTPDDLLLFCLLFIEHSGFTLRHRVAHSLMLIEDYSLENLQLIFVAIMRLAKYPIPRPKKEGVEDG